MRTSARTVPRLLLATLTALTLIAASAPVPLPSPPPPVASRPVTETFFGTSVTDRYRNLEDLTSPAVQAYFKHQNDYTRAILARLSPGRTPLLARIAKLDNAGTSVSGLQRVGDRYFYEKQRPGESEPKLYTRTVGGPERLLVDPATLSTDPAKHFTLNYFVPSWNGAYVAYGTSEGGSETLSAVTHVMDTATGKILPDALQHAGFGVTGWMLDNASFLYLRLPTLAPGESPMDAEQKIITMRHVLGTDQSADVPVIGYGVSPNLTFGASDLVDVVVSPASPWMLAVVQHGVQNEQTIYAAPLAAFSDGQTPWKKIVDVADGVEGEDLRGTTLYLRTHAGAPRFKVVALSLAAPDMAKAVTVVAPSTEIVENVSVAADGLYVLSRLGGFGRIRRFATAADGTISGSPATVKLPYDNGTIDAIVTDPRVAGTTFDETSWLKTLLYYRSDANLAVMTTDLKPPTLLDVSAYTSEEVNAPAADGTLIPLSIVRAKAFKADGSHPTYLEGYGAYGYTITPGFSTTRVAWLEHNGVYAVCHVRGGGWYGDEWHDAGKIATKVNTITDFIACGRWLVAHKYTSPAHLAGEGTSAGGILIGGAITRAPALFAAALDVVGTSNALRSEFSPNGPANIPEFGSVTTPEGFKALDAMDATQHVRSGVAYPAAMLCTGINDRRVPPWELGKFAAVLRDATTSGRPILLRVDYDAGHGFIGTSRAQSEALLADQYAFLLWQLGDPAFRQLPIRLWPR
jgi:prolyl oligopeptidase